MSILKTLQDYISQFEHMELQPLSRVLTDQVSKEASSYALAPAGNGKMSSDILGNKTYQNNYVFYAKEMASDETDRQDNYDFLEAFSLWLEDQNDNRIFPDFGDRYETEEIVVSNAMLFDIEEDGTGIYQVQIQINLKKRSM